MSSHDPSSQRNAGILTIVAVLLTAAVLRSPLTGVGTLITEIQADTALSHTLAGLLTTLPLVAFAVFALVAPGLSSRYGIERTLLYSTVLLGAGLIVRSLPSIQLLFAGTALIGVGIAVANVLIPAMIKQSFPLRIGLMTALYTSSMNLWSAIASGISLPLSRSGLGWRGSLAFWGLFAVATVLVWIPLTRRVPMQDLQTKGMKQPAAAGGVLTASISAQTDGSGLTPSPSPAIWRSPKAWTITLFMGFQSIMFYVGVSWLPEILHEKGMSMDSAGWMLSLMQILSMVGSFFMPFIATRAESQSSLAALSGAFFLFGFGGIWLASEAWSILFISLIGLGCGATFSLVILFFSLRTHSAKQASQLSAMAQSLGYLLAAVGPTLFGFIHDQSGGWSIPLATITAMSVITILLGFIAGKKGRISEL
ncbi:CynX/NimT family MFS transporter [Paenibacillus antibioticophila]|uniref:CynX/NimT family MFS transporter n=1 Tax=Paenibacillus antibioticophila TaxID=1274374 RepID=UPI0005CA39BB|nr:MFS transporter [Paenibacillus antibioticophila]